MTYRHQRHGPSALAVGALAGALLLSACGSSSSSTQSASTTSKSSINIGWVGDETGPLAVTNSAQGIALQAWVDTVNASGGIDGHMVVLWKADAKSDPTLEAAAYQQLGSAHNVVAFVGVGGINPAGANPYIEASKIPVIGGQVSVGTWNAAPLWYPAGSGGVTGYYALASAAKGKKLGIIYCVESSGCVQGADILKAVAPEAGTTVVNAQEVSLSAPDYTPNCLAAKQAGAQAIALAMTTTSILSIAADCAKQNYYPEYLLPGSSGSNSMPSAPGMSGSLIVQANWPYWDQSGPGAAMYAAMKKYEPGQPILDGTMEGWAAGNLFEQAAEAAAAKGAITSQSITAALNSIQNATLSGLTNDLSFSATGAQPPNLCWFSGTARGGKWVTNTPAPQCAPASDESTLAQLAIKYGG